MKFDPFGERAKRMSMSTHVTGFRPPDERWQAMKAVWDACTAAKTQIPDEVMAFFGDEAPDPRGVEVKIPFAEYKADMCEVPHVDLHPLCLPRSTSSDSRTVGRGS